jgi:hypothetical protein
VDDFYGCRFIFGCAEMMTAETKCGNFRIGFAKRPERDSAADRHFKAFDATEDAYVGS